MIHSGSPANTASLGLARKGFRGRIHTIAEGAQVEILHEGPLGRDPIAVRVNDTTIALRRREAMAVLVA